MPDMEPLNKNELEEVICTGCKETIQCPTNMKRADFHYYAICCELLEQGIKKENLEKEAKIQKPEIEEHWIKDEIVELFIELSFPAIWRQAKADLKAMSKRELAELSYGTGVHNFLDLLTAEKSPQNKKMLTSLRDSLQKFMEKYSGD